MPSYAESAAGAQPAMVCYSLRALFSAWRPPDPRTPAARGFGVMLCGPGARPKKIFAFDFLFSDPEKSVPRRPCPLASRPPSLPSVTTVPPHRRSYSAAPAAPYVPPSDVLPAACCRRAALPPTLTVPRRLYTHTLLSARPSLR